MLVKTIDYKIINDYWITLESSIEQPRFCNSLVSIEYSDFLKYFTKNEELKKLIDKVYKGDVFVVKNAFKKNFINQIKINFDQFTRLQESSFHKMKEGCPDFHRVIDENVSNLYSIKALKHSAYFFPWNSDKYKLFPVINERWRYLKLLGGRKFKEFENNTPKDGIVDRIQVLKYPPGGGLELHSDPYHNQRTFISIYMSKRGEEYKSGGFYVIDSNKNKLDMEKLIDIGDLGFGYATIMHGVDTIDGVDNCNWNTKNGRWFIGLYSNDSDEKENRLTSKQVKY